MFKVHIFAVLARSSAARSYAGEPGREAEGSKKPEQVWAALLLEQLFLERAHEKYVGYPLLFAQASEPPGLE